MISHLIRLGHAHFMTSLIIESKARENGGKGEQVLIQLAMVGCVLYHSMWVCMYG